MGFSRLYIRLFGRPSFAGFNRSLVRYGMKGLGVQNFGNEFSSGEIPFFQRIARQIDRRGAVILDIGAHVGNFTAAVLECTAHISVHAFEPNPTTFKQLEARFAGNPRVVLHNLAAGDTHSEAELFDVVTSAGSERATLVPGVLSSVKSTSVRVPLRPIDSVPGLEQVVFAKIDVEGFELNVLRGMRSILDGQEFYGLLMEFNTMNRQARVFLADIVAAVPTFDVFRILPGGRLLLLDVRDAMFSEIFAYQNLVLSRKKTAQ